MAAPLFFLRHKMGKTLDCGKKVHYNVGSYGYFYLRKDLKYGKGI